ncbi:MAG: hypothetical protein AAGM38_04525 [Pseudomonadota bacterium]
MQAETSQAEGQAAVEATPAQRRGAPAWTAWALLYCGLLALTLFID